jgi:hypothetical protein
MYFTSFSAAHRGRLILAFIALTIAASGISANPPPVKLPPQAKPIEGVVVPIPREIFGTLDRFAHSNWRAVQQPEIASWRPHGDQAQIALQLGVAIAEGFVAVEAQDSAEVKDVGRAVRGFARALGVEKTVLRRSKSIIDYASRNDWIATRSEWDGVLTDVRKGMIELQSEQLAQLVSLGGWLRGTEVLSQLLLQSYTADNAVLLRQPGLLDHFEKQLSIISANPDRSPIVTRMLEGLRQVRALTDGPQSQVTKNTANQVAGISAGLVAVVNGGSHSR